MEYDIGIIGAGVSGASIARELSKYKVKVILIEKYTSPAMGTTKANSGIVHGGYAAKHGTNKAKFNIMSLPLFEETCKELDVDYSRIGSFVVSLSEEKNELLYDLEDNGIKNNITDLEVIEDREKILEMEPNLNPDVTGILLCSGAAIVSPYELNIGLVENAIMNDVDFLPNSEVVSIKKNNKFKINLKSGKEITSKVVINAAGLYADKISAMMGLDYFTIKPRKGEYVLFDRAAMNVKHILFPVPTPISKGIVVSPTVSNNFFVGPNAQNIDDKEDRSCTLSGLREIIEGGQKLIPNLPLRDAITVFAGLRAVSDNNDFIIESTDVDGFINVAGIQSPGLSSCLGIAKYVASILEDIGITLKEDPSFNPIRKKLPRFAFLSPEEKDKLLEKDNNFGSVVCRCETITEAEIRSVIKSPLPARTMDDIKFRTRAGMGRCQGGFCTSRIIKILCDEYGVSPENITKKGSESELIIGNTKKLREEKE